MIIIAVHYALQVNTDEPSKRVELLHDTIFRHGTIFNTLAVFGEPMHRIVAMHARRTRRRCRASAAAQ